MGGLLAWWLVQPATSTDTSQPQANRAIGPTTLCQQLPEFVEAVGFGPQVLIDTSQQLVTGVALREPVEGGRVYNHTSWDDAGNLGPNVLDKNGNIYLAPVPLVSLYNNPPAEQNKIYRINAKTGVMQAFINLPWAQPPSVSNPFGVVGLAYDCETHSLYASSVAGSGPATELGRIYKVDLKTGEVVNQLENIDALGIGIFNGQQGKRLYYGAARTPEVYSIALTNTGDFAGEPRFEFSLAALPGGSQDNAHRFRFTRENELEIKGIEFGFKLLAASDPLRNVYRFRYNSDTDTWELVLAAAQ